MPIDDRVACGNSKVAGCAKRFSGHDGDILAFEKLLRRGGVARHVRIEVRGNVGENVERALRGRAGDPGNGPQARENTLATESILGEHGRNGVHRAAHSFESGILHDGGRVGCGLALQLGKRPDEDCGGPST